MIETSTTALILYDMTGRVWGIYQGVTEVPSGVLGFIAEIENKPISQVILDMSTTPPTPSILYGRTINDTDSEVTNLQDAIIELEERVNALEGN